MDYENCSKFRHQFCPEIPIHDNFLRFLPNDNNDFPICKYFEIFDDRLPLTLVPSLEDQQLFIEECGYHMYIQKEGEEIINLNMTDQENKLGVKFVYKQRGDIMYYQACNWYNPKDAIEESEDYEYKDSQQDIVSECESEDEFFDSKQGFDDDNTDDNQESEQHQAPMTYMPFDLSLAATLFEEESNEDESGSDEQAPMTYMPFDLTSAATLFEEESDVDESGPEEITGEITVEETHGLFEEESNEDKSGSDKPAPMTYMPFDLALAATLFEEESDEDESGLEETTDEITVEETHGLQDDNDKSENKDKPKMVYMPFDINKAISLFEEDSEDSFSDDKTVDSHDNDLKSAAEDMPNTALLESIDDTESKQEIVPTQEPETIAEELETEESPKPKMTFMPFDIKAAMTLFEEDSDSEHSMSENDEGTENELKSLSVWLFVILFIAKMKLIKYNSWSRKNKKTLQDIENYQLNMTTFNYKFNVEVVKPNNFFIIKAKGDGMCGVHALSSLVGLDYDSLHPEFKVFSNSDWFYSDQVEQVANKLGYNITFLDENLEYRAGNIPDTIYGNIYMIQSSNHYDALIVVKPEFYRIVEINNPEIFTKVNLILDYKPKKTDSQSRVCSTVEAIGREKTVNIKMADVVLFCVSIRRFMYRLINRKFYKSNTLIKRGEFHLPIFQHHFHKFFHIINKPVTEKALTTYLGKKGDPYDRNLEYFTKISSVNTNSIGYDYYNDFYNRNMSHYQTRNLYLTKGNFEAKKVYDRINRRYIMERTDFILPGYYILTQGRLKSINEQAVLNSVYFSVWFISKLVKHVKIRRIVDVTFVEEYTKSKLINDDNVDTLTTNPKCSLIDDPSRKFDWFEDSERVKSFNVCLYSIYFIVKLRNKLRESGYIVEDGTNDEAMETEIISETFCCKVPKLVKQDNFSTINILICQFKGKQPEVECLFNMMSICNNYLSIMDNLSKVSTNAIDFISLYTHFRHDVFDYLFKKFVMKVDAIFDDEKPIPMIGSRRTPDYYKISEDGKTVTIVEFTVVMNSQRGYFLKGRDKTTSVYKNELKMLEDLGYHTVYHPIFMSLSDDLSDNFKVWETYGYLHNNLAENLMNQYRRLINFEFNYLLSYNFNKYHETKKYPFADDFISSNMMHSENWRFQSINANKRLLYKFLKLMKDHLFLNNSFYNIRKIRGTDRRDFLVNEYSKPNVNTVPGNLLNNIKNDDLLLFNKFQKMLAGFDTCYVRTKSNLRESQYSTVHGFKVNDLSEDSPIQRMISRNNNFITNEQSLKMENVLLRNEMNNLNTKNDMSSLQKSLVKYKNENMSWMTTTHPTFVVENKPRRSFITYVDSNICTDIPYSDGPVLTDISVGSIGSSVLKVLYSKRINVDFSEFEDDQVNLDAEKELFTSSSKNLYGFLRSEGLEKKKMKLALLSLNDEKKTELENYLKSFKDAQRDYNTKLNKLGKRNNLIICDKFTNDLFKNEKNWESNRGYKLYMGELQDITLLMEDLKMSSKPMHFKFELPDNIQDAPFFLALKNKSLARFQENYKELMQTKLFNNAVFLSRLAYSLIAISNKSFNSKYFYVDNLGLKNCMLAVRGGKKITSTRKTKIFKLVYCCQKDLATWNPDINAYDDVFYDETPWMQLSQEMLQDLISAPYKVLMNYVYLRETLAASLSMDILCVPSLLMFHNRRKTEIMLHNMRYLCVNPMGDYSQVGKMLEDFSGPCYSAFDHSIRFGLSEHYSKYFQTIRKWAEHESNDNLVFQKSAVHHPYMKRYINSINDLTYLFYSTFLMSKGNYDQSLEQIVNLKKIMQTHEEYMENQLSNEPDLTEEGGVDIIKNNDFSFSKEISYNVGKLLAAELRRKHAGNHMNVKWYQLMKDPIDSMANNRGLRDKGKDFFGHKGYYVIYKKILESSHDRVLDIIEDPDLDDKKKHAKLSDINLTFEKEQETTKLEKVIFHVVDKSQRGGGREIFVMDYNTKLYQNPLEKMFKFVCEFIDNEIISIPAAKRANLIHKKCFEYQNPKYKTYYLTLDCRKWAPKSNPKKYLYMLLGMQDVLPDDFVKSCLEYFNVHEKKSIHTRKHIVDNFLKNEQNLKYSKYFSNHEEEGSVSFDMEYSFVMGIFNMLSSLLHAGAQKYAKYLFEKDLLERDIHVDFDMFAHSDDSGGRLSIMLDDKELLNKEISSFIGKYEFLMKCLNHLMSVKKCNISTAYFELLSILYLNKNLLPLLPKFLGNVSATFTGQGLSSDMKQVISKSIELTSNGASGSLAYMCQIILSNLYRNFYRVNMDLQLPSLGGFANSWPTLYFAYGSTVDEVRSCMYNPNFYRKFTSFSQKYLDYEITDSSINLKYKNILRIPRAYKNLKKEYSLPTFEDSQWFFENNKTRHSLLNAYWFIAKLSSSSFSVSLLNINEIRRMYDSLYMAKGNNIIGKFDNYNINQLLSLIVEEEEQIVPVEQTMRVMFRNLFHFYEFLDELKEPRFAPKEAISTKPSSLVLNNFVDAPITEFNALHLACQLIRPELMKYTFTNKRYGEELQIMEKYLDSLGLHKDIKTYKSFFDYMNKVRNETKYLYSDLPSKQRHLTSNSGLFEIIKTSFSKSEQISNLHLKYIEKTDSLKSMSTELAKYMMLYYFYIIYIQTKNDEIATIPIAKSLTGGETKFVANIPDVVRKNIKSKRYLTYLELIESNVTKPIVLDNLSEWSIWIKRQFKHGDIWVGQGTFHIKLDSEYMEVEVLNNAVTSIKHKRYSSKPLSIVAKDYWNSIMETFNLNYLFPVVVEYNKIYFGIDENNNLGFYSGNNIKLGISNSSNDISFDVSIYDKQMNHNFINGKHYVEMSNANYRLNTFDEYVYKKHHKLIFDTVDWDAISQSSKSVFMNAYFSGEYGSLSNLEYDREELISCFLGSDLYKFFYNNNKKGISVTQAFWDDITVNANNSEDIFPTLLENVGLSDMMSIIPKSKKDNLALYLFYDTDNSDLMTLRMQLSDIENHDDRLVYINKLIASMKDSQGMIALPEIGDPREFKKYRTLKLPHYVWVETIYLVVEALFNGYKALSDSGRIEITKLSCQIYTELNDLMYPVCAPMLSNVMLKIYDYQAMSNEALTCHKMLSLIFEERHAFAEFAKTFRKTHMRNVPRHPRYEQEWQIILANAFKFMNMVSIKEVTMKPSLIRSARADKLPDIYPQYLPSRPFYNGPAVPPCLKIMFQTNNLDPYLSKGKINAMDIMDFELLKNFRFFGSNTETKDHFMEMLNDLPISPKINATVKLKKESSKIIMITDVDELIDYCNRSISNSNKAMAIKPLHDFYKSKKLVIVSPKGHHFVYYVYNYNGKDIPNTPEREKLLVKQYISFYEKGIKTKLPFVEKMGKPVKLDIDLKPDMQNLIVSENISNQDTYNENLIDRLIPKMGLKKECKDDMMEIIRMNITAIGKFQRLKKYIKDKQEDTKVSLDIILNDVLKDLKISNKEIGGMLLEKKSLRNDITKTTNNPYEIVGKLSTYKKEIAQAESLMFDNFSKLMTSGLKLTDSMKTFLINNFKLIAMQLNVSKLQNERAAVLVQLDIIKSAETGTAAPDNMVFEEKIRMALNDLQLRLLEKMDTDLEDIPKPVYSINDLSVRARR